MRISPEVAAQYENNRLQMAAVNKGFRTYMWCSIILGAMIFSTAFFAGALSTVNGNAEGPGIFYNAMSAGTFQILLGLATIVLGWLTATKMRVPSLILLGIDVFGLLMILLRRNGTFSGANLLFLAAGIALNIWAQMLCNRNDELKTQPGYPLFSVEADTPAHYELPADVRIRQQQASAHMKGISAPQQAPAQMSGTAAPQQALTPPTVSAQSAFAPSPNLFSDPAPVKLPPEVKIPAVTEKTLGITDMPGSARQFATKPELLSAPSDAALDALSAQTPQVNETALPQIDPSAMLADMTAIPSHAVKQGNPDMLPTPEEVRARLAAMKRARDEHHPEV